MSFDNSDPTVTNCTFFGNTANVNGGGMVLKNESTAVVTNCILWGNMAGNPLVSDQIYDTASPITSTITYSDVQGGCEETSCTTVSVGNIDQDPLFESSTNLRLTCPTPASNCSP